MVNPIPVDEIISNEINYRISLQYRIKEAIKIIEDGLNYYEHDGHHMPKSVARDALDVLLGKRIGSWRKSETL
jgi:hypothetical protein